VATTTKSVTDIARAAREASRELALASTEAKNAALERIATELEARRNEILAANEADLEEGRAIDIGDALLDRLALDDQRIAARSSTRRRGRTDCASRPRRCRSASSRSSTRRGRT
jgi:glutamate-5-semialdehyde dehydrogenase